MPQQMMDVEMPDGVVVEDVPVGTPKAVILQKYMASKAPSQQKQMQDSVAIAKKNIANYPKPLTAGQGVGLAMRNLPGAMVDTAGGAFRRLADISGASAQSEIFKGNAPALDKFAASIKQSLMGSPMLPVGLVAGIGQNAGYTLHAKDSGDKAGMIIGAGGTLNPFAMGAPSVYENAKKNPGPASVGYGLPDIAANAAMLAAPHFQGGQKPQPSAVTPAAEEALTGVMNKRVAPNLDPHTEVSQPSLPALREAAGQMGVKPEQFTGRQGPSTHLAIVDRAIQNQQGAFSRVMDSIPQDPVSAQPIADRLLSMSEQPGFADANPGAAKFLEKFAARFADKQMSPKELNGMRLQWNKELNSFYSQGTGKQIAATPRIRAIEAATDVTRDLVYDTMQERSGVNVTPLKQTESALISARDAAVKLNREMSVSQGVQRSVPLRQKLVSAASKPWEQGVKDAFKLSDVQEANARLKKVYF